MKTGIDGGREGWQASAEARSLTTVRKGAQARSPINYNLDPPLFSFLSLTHFLLHSTILPLPLILPWSLSSAPINQSLLPPYLPPLSFLPPSPSHYAPPPSLYQPSSSSLATPLLPFIVGSAVGVERSEVGRREGEKEEEEEAEAIREM